LGPQEELKQYHTIWTPELVELSLPLAGIARRCLARILDQALLLVIYSAIFFVMMILPGIMHYHLLRSAVTTALIGCLVLFSLAEFTYFWAFHNWMNGQTPGKKMLHIRVVTHRGGKINAVTSLIRSLFNIVDMLLFTGGISALIILLTPQEKRIADFAAETLVIYEG
jgi:uncharacterized RDD family membrane protein YckC